MKRPCRLSFLTTFLAVLFLQDLSALEPDRKLTEYLQANFNSEKGLPEDTVLSITQSPDGYLWFGGYHGISRFDGNRFVSLNELTGSHTSIRTVGFLFFDSRGHFWIGTFAGLYRLDGKILHKFTEKEGVPDSLFYSAAEDPSGTVWIASGEGLLKWEGSRFKKYDNSEGLPSRYVHAVTADSAGTIWAGTLEGLSVFKNGKFRNYTKKDGLANNAIWSIVSAQDGSYWIGTEGGLSHFRDGKFTNYTETDGLANNIVNTLRLDGHGALWIGTEGGMSRLYNGKIETITSKQGLSKNAVWQIFEDSEENLWVGMNYGGVSRFTDARVQVIGKKEGLSTDTVTTILEDSKGIMWIGTDDGLNRIENGSFSVLTTDQGLLSNYISSLHEDSQGILWIGTHEGLNRIVSGKIESYTTAEGLMNPVVLAITQESNGTVWIGTNMGMNEWKNGHLIPHPGLVQGTASWLVASKDKGFWVSTLDGIVLYDNGRAQNLTLRQSLETSCLHQDSEDTIWVGTFTEGLWRYSKGKWTRFRSQDGLGTDMIAGILEDSEKNLWLSTNHGIFRVAKDELENFATGKSSKIKSFHLGTSDGMRKLECYDGQQPVVWKSKDGRFWFATLGGAAIVDPMRIKINPYRPKCHIEKMMLNGKEIDVGRNQTLPPGSSNFEFHYNALSFTAPEKVQFRYQLEGFDKDWIEGGTRRIAQYTNIPPDSYTFRIQACNNDGLWNVEGAAFLFTVRPYFYQTRWFYALCAAIIALTFWRIHRYRVKRALEIERIRTHIATDLHDDIGAGLSQIAVLAEVIRQNPQQYETPDRLKQVMVTAQELMESMSDIVWAVNPSRDRVEDLTQRMRRFANDLLSAADMELKFRSVDLEKTRKLSPDFKRHVYLIFKECVNNAVKHSQGKSVTVELSLNRVGMLLSVCDDGKGFKISDSFDGNGLKSMRARAQLLGGNFRLSSEPGKGTSMELEIPFKHRATPVKESESARKLFRATRWG